MRRTTSAGNDHPESLVTGLFREGHHLEGRAVGRQHAHLHRNAELPQNRRSWLHRGQIGVAAHHHGDTNRS